MHLEFPTTVISIVLGGGGGGGGGGGIFSVGPSSENAWSKHLNVGVVEVTSTVPKPCEVIVLVQPHEKGDTVWAGVHCNNRSDNESGETNAQA